MVHPAWGAGGCLFGEGEHLLESLWAAAEDGGDDVFGVVDGVVQLAAAAVVVAGADGVGVAECVGCALLYPYFGAAEGGSVDVDAHCASGGVCPGAESCVCHFEILLRFRPVPLGLRCKLCCLHVCYYARKTNKNTPKM